MSEPPSFRGDAPPFNPSSLLRGDAPTFHSDPLCGNAPTFHPTATAHQPRRRRHRHRPPPQPKAQPQSAFLSRFPGEIRNTIYELALLSPDPIPAVTIVSDHSSNGYNEDSDNNSNGKKIWSSNVPALAQTCRQIRSESLGIYFAGNVFVFAPPPEREDISRGLVNGWVKSLAGMRVERCVQRVGCVWQSNVVEEMRVVSKRMMIVATLGEDESLEARREKKEQQQEQDKQESQQGGLQWRSTVAALPGEDGVVKAKPKVVFEVDRDIEGLCRHVLARCAQAFERRRLEKSVRGYGALIDVVLTVCDFLRPIEWDIYPHECALCEAEWRQLLESR